MDDEIKNKKLVECKLRHHVNNAKTRINSQKQRKEERKRKADALNEEAESE